MSVLACLRFLMNRESHFLIFLILLNPIYTGGGGGGGVWGGVDSTTQSDFLQLLVN